MIGVVSKSHESGRGTAPFVLGLIFFGNRSPPEQIKIAQKRIKEGAVYIDSI